MEIKTFAKNMILNNLLQPQTIIQRLRQAQTENGALYIIYEGKIPKELIELLRDEFSIKVEELQTTSTGFCGRILNRIYPNAQLNPSDVANAINGKSYNIGGNNMGHELARMLMLNNIKRQIDVVLNEMIGLVNEGKGKGAVLHEGILIPEVIGYLEEQGIAVEEVDTKGSDEIDKVLYNIYPDVDINSNLGYQQFEAITSEEVLDAIKAKQLGLCIKQRIIPIQKQKIVEGLVKKVGDENGNISIEFDGMIYKEVEDYMSSQGIGIHRLDTSGSNRVGEHLYHIHPEASLSKEEQDNALINPLEVKVIDRDLVRALLREGMLGKFLTNASFKKQVDAIEKMLQEANARGRMDCNYSGVLYEETIALLSESGIIIEPIDYSRTNRVGQTGYRIYPDVKLERSDIENAIYFTESGDDERQ